MFRIGKRLTAVLLAVLLFAVCISVLAGCDADEQTPEDTDHLPALRIGSDEYPPYFYIGEDGNFAGIDVELATEACRRMGFRAEFVRISWSEKDEALQNGEVDCLWGSFSMTGREDRYDWAGPYMQSRQMVAVRADSEIFTLADLANKRIAVQATTKPDELFSAGNDSRIPQIKQLYCMFDMENIFAALRKGYVDAIAGHETALLEKMKSVSGTYRILDEPLMNVELGVAFKKGGDKQPAEHLTQTLGQMRRDGFTAEVLEKFGLGPERAR